MVNYAAAAARVANGFKEDGFARARVVGAADVVDGNPNEWLNALTG
jgi:hypothetical protein